MELTPQALHDVEFREARRGGYNTRDVDDFLERVAIGIGQLQDRLREAYHRAEAAEARLVDMQRQLDDVQRRGPEGPSDADETLRRTLVLAQRTADATIKEAKDEADRVLTEARDEASRVRASAESDARRDARAEIEQLASSREDLLRDIESLEQHVDEQRSSIRSGIDKLLQLVDDRDTLSTKDAPSVSEAPSFMSEPPPPPPSPEPPSNGRIAPAANADSTPEPNPVSPFGGRQNDGSMVAALQELPRREPREPREPLVDPVPPTEPVNVPSFDPPPFETPSYEKASFDPPPFEPPAAPPYEPPAYEAPAFEAPSFDPPPGGPTGFFPDLRAAFDPPGARPEQPPADPGGLDDLPLPIDAPPPPPPPPGLEHLNDVGGIPIEPGSRPSEWGRGVFDSDEEETPGRFGRR